MTDRELLVMVMHLPEESAYRTALRDDPWTSRNHQLANIQDLLVFYRADFAKANGGEMAATPVKRPGDAQRDAERLAASKAKHDDLMASMRGTTP